MTLPRSLWALLTLTACLPAPSYLEPGHAELAVGTRLAPTEQQGRWACRGFDFVLSNGALYELNQDYVMRDGTRTGYGMEFYYRIGGVVVLFAIPSDSTRPAFVTTSGTIEVARADLSLLTAHVEVSKSEAVNARDLCPPAPPVRVW